MNIIKVPEILLPKNGIDLKKWAVIACDQYTSDEKYWNELNDYCGETSTLRIIYPEIFINDNQDSRIKSINQTMEKYLSNGIFDTYKGFILTVRHTSYGNRRVGLILSFDLEEYEINEKRSVRATEATVKERLPVRIKIRENSPIELPHALVLIDDETKSIIEPLYEKRNDLIKLYSTELNMEGGRLDGYLIQDTDSVIKSLQKLSSTENLLRKYGSDLPFMFAVGDGNHSIATAKACWDKLKKNLTDEEKINHPARFCLVEVNNIYDDYLNFEPINRVVFNVKDDFIDGINKSLSGEGEIELRYKGVQYVQSVNKNSAVAIGEIQRYIDKYIESHSGVWQDYVHGVEDTYKVAENKSGIAIIMPKLRKSELFPFVAKNGTLTRKSFSMGEAKEKRYYFECRKIK